VRELSAYDFVDARYKENNGDKIFVNSGTDIKVPHHSKSGYLWHTIDSVFLALCGRRVAI
jgi:hypothetical protein